MRLLLVVALVGCYAPMPTTGAPCNTSRKCPTPLVCDDGLCVVEAAPDGGTDGAAIDADLTCVCQDADTLACAAATPIPCSLGCVADSPGAHCAALVPSNDVPADVAGVASTITIDGAVVIDTDTGEITGSLTRAPGEGVIADIGFTQRLSGTATLGVFTVHELAITNTGSVRLTGSRAAVFLVGTNAAIAGTIDGSGGCDGSDLACAGPGGGTGAAFDEVAGGCSGGGAGQHDPNPMTGADGGGGGGGGGAVGGAGGNAGGFSGGPGGLECMPIDLVPLVGGSGGGGGSPGAVAVGPHGGGGGGALQITALEGIKVTGTILMAGAGGTGGPGIQGNAAGGAGGGAGGGILLEAPIVHLTQASRLAANGGGGGGAGRLMTSGANGETGHATTQPAAGGVALSPCSSGGSGGVGAAPAAVAASVVSPYNAGGGGGGVGRIYVRSQQLLTMGTTSPDPGSGPLSSR